MSDANSIELPEITDKRFFGHPMGLAVLFFAEMWERFSYYGMRALLMFYLVTEHWLFSAKEIQHVVYGAYTSLVYITPVLGGYLADKFLGQRKAVVPTGRLLLTLRPRPDGLRGRRYGTTLAIADPNLLPRPRVYHRRLGILEGEYFCNRRSALSQSGPMSAGMVPTPFSTWAST